jgi:hypothetical protein
MVRGLILGALAFGGVFLAERQFAEIAKDIKRYDSMRAMSGDPPLLRQALKSATDMISSFGASRQDEAQSLIASFTQDIVRYATIRSM